MSKPVVSKILEIIKTLVSTSRKPTLMKIQRKYEEELLPNCFTYSLQEPGHKPIVVKLLFNKGNFCHLYSIGSIVKGQTPDLDQFSGMDGWDNIANGRITFKTLRQMNPQQFDYYHPEYGMSDEMIATIQDPSVIKWDPSRVPGSKLKCDYILYKVFGSNCIHIGISRDEDGTYFPRSYFVRSVTKDKSYPTKYVANMKNYKVRTKISKRK